MRRLFIKEALRALVEFKSLEFVPKPGIRFYLDNNYFLIRARNSPYQLFLNPKLVMFDRNEGCSRITREITFHFTPAMKEQMSILNVRNEDAIIHNVESNGNMIRGFSRIRLENLLDRTDVDPEFRQDLIFNLDLFR